MRAASRGLAVAYDFDLVCIGGGSGGLAAAQRAYEYCAKAAVIESIVDRKEGVGNDYRFTIRSMKFYIAKCKIPQMPSPDTAFSMMEYQLLTKKIDHSKRDSKF